MESLDGGLEGLEGLVVGDGIYTRRSERFRHMFVSSRIVSSCLFPKQRSVKGSDVLSVLNNRCGGRDNVSYSSGGVAVVQPRRGRGQADVSCSGLEAVLEVGLEAASEAGLDIGLEVGLEAGLEAGLEELEVGLEVGDCAGGWGNSHRPLPGLR